MGAKIRMGVLWNKTTRVERNSIAFLSFQFNSKSIMRSIKCKLILSATLPTVRSHSKIFAAWFVIAYAWEKLFELYGSVKRQYDCIRTSTYPFNHTQLNHWMKAGCKWRSTPHVAPSINHTSAQKPENVNRIHSTASRVHTAVEYT